MRAIHDTVQDVALIFQALDGGLNLSAAPKAAPKGGSTVFAAGEARTGSEAKCTNHGPGATH